MIKILKKTIEISDIRIIEFELITDPAYNEVAIQLIVNGRKLDKVHSTSSETYLKSYFSRYGFNEDSIWIHLKEYIKETKDIETVDINDIFISTNWKKPIKFFNLTFQHDESDDEYYYIIDNGEILGFIEKFNRMDKLFTKCLVCGDELITKFYGDKITNCNGKDVTSLIQIPYAYQCNNCLNDKIVNLNSKFAYEKFKIRDNINRINSMTREAMCRLWLSSPAGHPYFIRDSKEWTAFDKRFNKLGGMSPEISKKIMREND